MNLNKPKLLVITSSYPKFKDDINGNFVYDLSSRLIEDFEIHVLAPMYKGALKDETIDGIKIHRHKQFFINSVELAYGIGIYENLKKNKYKYFVLPFYFFYLITSLIRVIKKEKIFICHAHWLIPNALLVVLCKKVFFKKLKILATIHGSDFWGFDNFIGNYLKKVTLNNVNELSVVSKAIKEKVVEIGYKNDVHVYPMGVNTTLFSPEKKDLNLKEKLEIKGIFLLFVGVIVEQKGIRHLIDAIPSVLKEHPDAKLVVVGDGNLKNTMIALTKEYNISQNILFTGAIPHDDLPKYFATADLFVLPSLSEGWPVVVMEALSAGCTSIVTEIPVFKELKGKFKFLEVIKLENSNEISKAVNKLLKESFKLDLSKDAQIFAKNNFDWEVVSKNYKSLLLKL